MTAEVEVDTALLRVEVRGQPKPKGSLRHVGHGRMVEQVTGSSAWRLAIKDAAITAATAVGITEPVTGPVSVYANVTVPKPKSAPKKRRTWPITRSSGDLDKHARNILDALVDAGVLADDSQVVALHLTKSYPGESARALPTPGLYVALFPVGDQT